MTMDANVIQPKLFEPPAIFLGDTGIKIMKEIIDLISWEHMPVFNNLSNNAFEVEDESK